MDGIIFGVFTLSIVLLFGAIYHLLAIKKPGFYPPRTILKKRAVALAGSGAIGILMGIILSMFK